LADRIRQVMQWILMVLTVAESAITVVDLVTLLRIALHQGNPNTSALLKQQMW